MCAVLFFVLTNTLNVNTITIMRTTYTQHALARMAERGISRAEVEATLAQPLRTVAANHGRTESQGWIERAGKRQLLRVLTEGDVVVLVITVMATSKIAKYGVTPGEEA